MIHKCNGSAPVVCNFCNTEVYATTQTAEELGWVGFSGPIKTEIGYRIYGVCAECKVKIAPDVEIEMEITGNA